MSKPKSPFVLHTIFQILVVCSFTLYTFCLNPAKLVSAQSNHQEEVRECNTVQVMFIIDYSGSMYLRNDLNKLRVSAPLNVVDILADKYLSAPVDLSQGKVAKRFEISAILFASAVPNKYVLNWTLIAPESRDAWALQRQHIAEQLSPAPSDFITSGGGNGTNFVYAFQAANRLWKSASVPDAGCVEKISLLLTDGAPSTAEPLEGVELVSHMQAVEDLLDNYLDEEGNLFVTAIDDQDEEYWSYMESYWKKISRSEASDTILRAERVLSQAEIGQRMAMIINQAVQAGAFQVPVGSLVVPPYLQSMVLTYYKSDTNDVLVLTDIDGKIVNAARTDIKVLESGEETAIQRLEIVKPVPGEYQLATSLNREKVIITMQMVFANAELLEPNSPMQQFTNGIVTFKLIDRDGFPLPVYKDPLYDLQVTASVANTRPVASVSLVSNQDGTYTGIFTPVDAVTHSVQVSAIAQDISRRTWPVLESDEFKTSQPLSQGADANFINIGEFSVDPVEVREGQAQSVQPNCGLYQFIDFSVPLIIYNKRTGLPTTISLPVSWDVEAFDTNGTKIQAKVNGPDESGKYSLAVSPTTDKEIIVSLRANALDPQTGKPLVIFYEKELHYLISQGLRAKFELLSVEQQADPMSRFIEKFLGAGSESILAGRSLFFINRDIRLTAQLTDEDRDSVVNDSTLLPNLELIELDTGKMISAQPWTSVSVTDSGKYYTTFLSPGLGKYQIKINPATLPCGVQVVSDSSVTNVLLVSDLLERLITILLLSAGIYLVFWLIIEIICRLKPLYGFLKIGNDTHYAWMGNLSGRQCHSFKIKEPHNSCYVSRVLVRSFFGPVTIYIIKIDPGTGKELKPQKYGPFQRGSRILIPLSSQCDLRNISNESQQGIYKDF